MPVTRELATTQQAVTALEGLVSALEARYGPCSGTRRLHSDVLRIREDLADLAELPVPPPAPMVEPVFVPDTDYDPSFWQGADDEGIGHASY